jgi:hypothetical protein
MSDTSFKIRKSATFIPVSAPTLNNQGEVAYDSSDDKLKVRGSSVTDSVVTEDRTQDLLNKTIESSTIDADLNTISNIEDANIKAGAAIDAAKLADGSVSNTEFQYLNGVTSAIQTQLDGKVTGPVSAVDNTIPRFDGTTGELIQGSNVVISDLDAITGVTELTVDNVNVNGSTVSSVGSTLTLSAASGFNVALTATGGGVVDVTGTLDVAGQIDIDNLRLDTNTVSSTNTNGNIILDPNGTGVVQVAAPLTAEQLDVDNIRIETNTISSTNTNGNIILDPNGTGLVQVDATLSALSVTVDNLQLDANTISSTNANGNILLDPNGTGIVSVESTPLRLPEIATPATPASGYINIYAKSDGRLYQQDDTGIESILAANTYVGLVVNTTTTTISSALTDIVFTNKVEDTHSAYNTTTGIWTCPVTGRYEMTGAIFSSGTFGLDTRVNCMIQVNGVDTAAALSRAGGAVTNLGSGVAIAVRNITAGQTVKFRGASQAGTPAIVSDTTLTYFNIKRVY